MLDRSPSRWTGKLRSVPVTDQAAGQRFLTIPQVAEELATSPAQILALIKRGELGALQIGGRGQWRIERVRLEEYIARCYPRSFLRVSMASLRG